MAFIYPTILTTVAFAVVVSLMVYVVPQVTRVFENGGQTLPLVTRILIGMSDFVRAVGVWWLMGLAAIVGARLALKQPDLRRRWHASLLRLPVVGRLTRGVNAARLNQHLGILTASGIPLPERHAVGGGGGDRPADARTRSRRLRQVREAAGWRAPRR